MLTALLGQSEIVDFWAAHGAVIKSALASEDARTVVSYNFRTTYGQRLPLVFEALDGLVPSEPPDSENAVTPGGEA